MTGTDLETPRNFTLLAALEEAGAIVENGLILPPGISYERYEAIGRNLWVARDMIQFLIGDWLNYGEDEYDHDLYVQAAAMTGASDQTLINWKSTSKRVPHQRRRIGKVKWSLHAEVAALGAGDQRRILKRAEDERLTKAQVRDLRLEAQGVEPPRSEVEHTLCESCGRPLL